MSLKRSPLASGRHLDRIRRCSRRQYALSSLLQEGAATQVTASSRDSVDEQGRPADLLSVLARFGPNKSFSPHSAIRDASLFMAIGD